MHARQFVELAGWAAAHAQELLESNLPAPETAWEQYWVASKCRLERWKWFLHSLKSPQDPPPSGARDSEDAFLKETEPFPSSPSGFRKGRPTSRLLAAMEEILLSEVFSRIWTVLMEAYDQRRSIQQAGPIARNVLMDHLEVRSRLLRVLLQPEEWLLPEVEHLNQLRSHVERWTDLFLGVLADWTPTKDLAFDPRRVQDFSGDFSLERPASVRQQAWNLTLRSIRRAFAAGLQPISANPDLNEAIAQAAVACWPKAIPLSSLLDDSLWPVRLAQSAADLQELVGTLLDEETTL